ncbi:MAG: ABC transporter ATP-binding protein, partial [Planctomycetes bacterium]|nr:ABC transporter ATP-binding protein [Planctomycetota bacterium]
FWALRDVSFEVRRGEVLGIIGRNGAGKSTLLKILSRITEPTEGRIRLRGRVASLLEVGTGFHPELSGRENVFLNGAILGMTKAEIKAKFDEIVAFSEVEKFLDTPVKHYSSGMYVRLAFAVAAHLDPEILIIDEVLAVGDAQFQKKCLGKMKDVAAGGRTVIVVSHQMTTITGLCDRGIMLRRGSVIFDGPAAEAALHYQSIGGSHRGSIFDAEATGKPIGNDYARLHRAWTTMLSGEPASSFDLEDPIKVWMEYSVFKPGSLQTYPNFHFFDETGNYLFVSAGLTKENESALNRPGRWICSCTLPGGLLNTGSFTVGVVVTTMNPGVQVAFFERDALMFQVTEDIQATLDAKRMGYAGPIPGTLRPSLPWTVEMVGSPEMAAR